MKNMSKITCYCGQDGDQKLNMLQCVKCKHWFHEDCVKCLDMPMLYGDRFYIFICSLCNAGSECLARLEMKWAEIVQLLLYNLTIEHKKKYFDLDASVVPFLHENWDRFQILGPIANEKNPDLRSKVLQVLQSFKIFKSGKEIKKSKNIWGLRERTPPEAPVVQPSAARIQNDVVVWDFQVKERAYQVLTTKKPLANKDASKNGKSKTKTSVTAPSRPKINEVSKCRGSVPHCENGILKAKHRTQRTGCISFNEDSARLGLLDSLIPFPPDFKHRNNPFQKTSKMNIVRRLNHQMNKTQIKHTKRRHEENSFIEPIQNGNHNLIDSIRTSYFEKNVPTTGASLFTTKDLLSHEMLPAKKDSIYIIGKRVTTTGKVQFLCQKNR